MLEHPYLFALIAIGFVICGIIWCMKRRNAQQQQGDGDYYDQQQQQIDQQQYYGSGGGGGPVGSDPNANYNSANAASYGYTYANNPQEALLPGKMMGNEDGESAAAYYYQNNPENNTAPLPPPPQEAAAASSSMPQSAYDGGPPPSLPGAGMVPLGGEGVQAPYQNYNYGYGDGNGGGGGGGAAAGGNYYNNNNSATGAPPMPMGRGTVPPTLFGANDNITNNAPSNNQEDEDGFPIVDKEQL